MNRREQKAATPGDDGFFVAIHKGPIGCGKPVMLSNFMPTHGTPVLASLGFFWLDGKPHSNSDMLLCESCARFPVGFSADWFEPLDRAKHLPPGHPRLRRYEGGAA